MPIPTEPLTPQQLPVRAWIAAGSRDGDRTSNMRTALALLADQGVAIHKVSSIYETEPVDLPGDLPLLNGALEVRTSLDPGALLAACLDVEMTLGRRRELGRDASRTIDLDLLLYGERILHQPGLTLPHPRMHLRRFVLLPLAEVAPDLRHPVLGRTVSELLEACGDPAWVRLSAPPAAWWGGEHVV